MSDVSPAEQKEPFVGREMTASLTVNDLERRLAWYCDVLGFAIDQRHERESRLMAVSVRGGSVRLVIGRDDGKKGLDRVKGEGLSLMITTSQNVDALAKRIKPSGGTLDSKPMDMPWGARVFRLRDPDGFRLAISS